MRLYLIMVEAKSQSISCRSAPASKFSATNLPLCCLYFFPANRKMGWKFRLGLHGLLRRVEKQRIAKIVTWRAGLWTEAFGTINALRKWRVYAQAQRDLENSLQIAEGHSKAKKDVRSGRGSPFVRHVFLTLSCHARNRNAKRHAFQAWSIYTQRKSHVKKQVCIFVITVGVRHEGCNYLDEVLAAAQV